MSLRRPPPYAVSGPALREATEVEFFVAGGPGGQHHNKTETGVRLHHGPSGVLVTATERRSRSANLDAAWERLRARLERLNHVPKRRVATKVSRGQKRRRLEDKARASEKKQARRRPDEP
jgi:protein subunit release factor B